VLAELPDLPPALSQLLQEFEHLFQPPTELPPSRACDHSIPLIEGASPVFIRPYHYAPLLKTKIENQVKEMLGHGIIQRSTSPFSSLVILVKKKDNTWRFYVDYRHLNAITKRASFQCQLLMNCLTNWLMHLGSQVWTSVLDSIRSE
jgi:hypothetical protein